jgi:peptidoglycan hydrolase-like protein with peptidoglycan-binding domain
MPVSTLAKTLTSYPLLQMGSQGAYVKEWQRYMVREGYDLGTSGPSGDGVDGDFGPKTYNATIAWQTKYGKQVDGKVGRESWSGYLLNTQAPPGIEEPPLAAAPPVADQSSEDATILGNTLAYMKHIPEEEGPSGVPTGAKLALLITGGVVGLAYVALRVSTRD